MGHSCSNSKVHETSFSSPFWIHACCSVSRVPNISDTVCVSVAPITTRSQQAVDEAGSTWKTCGATCPFDRVLVTHGKLVMQILYKLPLSMQFAEDCQTCTCRCETSVKKRHQPVCSIHKVSHDSSMNTGNHSLCNAPNPQFRGLLGSSPHTATPTPTQSSCSARWVHNSSHARAR